MAELEARIETDLREQQRALGRVLRAIAEGGGLQSVLDEIVEASTALGGGDHARIYLVDGGTLRALANYGATEGFDYDLAHPHPIERGSLAGRTALERAPIQIPDVLADPEYTYEGSTVAYRAGLGVPLLVDGELLGSLVVVRAEPGVFGDDSVELVRAFADQAAIAIKNARLLDALQRQLEQQRAISDVLGAVARREGLQAVLDEVVRKATMLSGGEDGRLWLGRDGNMHAFANYGSTEGYEYEKEHPIAPDRRTMTGRAALTREIVHIPDVTLDEDYGYAGPTYFRAGLTVPILVEGELIGAIGVVRTEAGAFADEQIELVRTFADQAAIAIANTRLIEAVERQLEQQRAISDVLGAVAQSGRLETVFEAVVEAATRLCQADWGALHLADGDVLRLATHHKDNCALEEYERAHPHVRDRSTAVGRVALTREVVHIPDVRADPEYDWDGVEIEEYHAVLGAPILVDDELIGTFFVTRVAPGPFTDEQVGLIRTFADQAAIAIANARLLGAVERQLEQQRAISDVLGAVARGEGQESVLHALVESACRLCGAQFGEVYLVDGDVLRLAVGHGGPPELYDYEREHPEPIAGDRRSVNGRVLLTQDVVHIPDIFEDEDYSWSAANAAGVRALLGAPLLVEGRLVGVFNIVRTAPSAFGEDEIELLRTFADQAAIAVANARLMSAVESQLDQHQAIGDILRAVARSEGLDAVFGVVIERATRLCNAEYGAVYLKQGEVLQVVMQRYARPDLYEYEQEPPHPIDRSTVIGRAALTRDVVHIPDTHHDPEYSWGASRILEFRSLLGAPIIVEDELIGAMNIVRIEPEPFAQEHVDLMRTFADQAAIAIANARLMDAVERQRTELARFVSPQVAELVSSGEGERMLAGHRAYVSCLFCDLRGFTAFSETAAPEELFDVLGEYHQMIGELVPRYEGTLEHFAGDGVMVFFNDPLPVANHELAAIGFALAAQEGFQGLAATWRKRGIELGLGIGIAAGYATLGRIGFEGRYDYGALGPVTNLASRLSDQAQPGQTLVSQRVYAAVEDRVELASGGELELKGFGRPVVAYEILGVK